MKRMTLALLAGMILASGGCGKGDDTSGTAGKPPKKSKGTIGISVLTLTKV